MAEIRSRRVVGILGQIWILMWKNWVLFKRNISGTLVEILVSYVFLLLLLLLRFFVDVSLYPDQNNTAYSPLQYLNTSTDGRYRLMYYPNDNSIKAIIDDAVAMMKSVKPQFNVTVEGTSYSSASSLNVSTTSTLFALVSFPASYTSGLPKKIEYTIYTQESASYQYNIKSNTVSLSSMLYSNSPEYYCRSTVNSQLYSTVFAPLKYAVDMTLIETTSGSFTAANDQVKATLFNCPEYRDDLFHTTFSFFPRALIVIAYLFTLIVTLGAIINEKQTKMKEYLKMVGIRWYSIWITWIIRTFIPYLILTILLSVISMAQLSARSSGPKKAIYMYTNFTVVFSTYFVYAVQCTMFTLMLGQIFSTSFIGKTMAIIIWLITILDFFTSSSNAIKYILCIFPNWGFLFATTVIFQYERSGKTLNFSSLYNNLYGDSLNLGGVLGFQLFWTLMYVPVTWYIERIFPGEYGAPQPFYFPFMPSYWFDSSRSKVSDSANLELSPAVEEKFGFEKDPESLSAVISIENLTKKFKIGLGFKEKTVVDNMCIKFYENQITGFLGHNGAGKTTTTFMLCGIYAPTSGDAFIMGKSIRTKLDEIRSSLGFCPQHDILYDDLTVAEHIDLIASIKGYSKKEIKNEIREISRCVGLHNDLEKKSKQLSGGMKRRLSVAMALTGGAKVIILDEPTSGLDPYNRRTLWELIRKFKEGRTIILTTHFMEEADALSDRIAIVNHGQVKCCGSPLFLKNTFGSGYLLTIAKGSGFDEYLFKNDMLTLVQNFNIETNIAAEMCITIPFAESPKLAQLLQSIENKKATYGIEGYGISSPTIEEVFIKVGSIDAGDHNHDVKQPPEYVPNQALALSYDPENGEAVKMPIQNNGLEEKDLSSAFADDFKKNSGILFWLEQMYSLWIKRFRIFYRRYILAIFILLVPLVLKSALTPIIPSGTNQVNTLSSTTTVVLGTYTLGLSQIGSQILPYTMNGAVSLTTLQSLFYAYYPSSSGITLYNMSSDYINNYVLGLRKSSLINLYGNYYAGVSLNLASATNLQATIYGSSMAFHSAASVLNDVDTLIFQTAMSGSTDYSISTINSPIQASDSQSYRREFLKVLACLDILPNSLYNFIMSIIVAYMIAISTMHIARERINGSKQLQLLSGTHYSTYWLANFLFDWPIFVVQSFLLVILLAIINAGRNDNTVEIYAIASSGSIMISYFFLLFFSSFAWCLFAYLWSFLFKSDIIGFVVLLITLGFMAFIDIILLFIQILMVDGSGKTNGGAGILSLIRYLLALIFPNVTVKRGVYDLKISSNAYCINATNVFTGSSFKYADQPFAATEPGIGLLVIFSIIQFVVLAIILLIHESKLFSRCCDCSNCRTPKPVPRQELEEDVEAESNRIRNSDLKQVSKEEPLVVHDLVRRFKKGKKDFIAVNNLSFGIAKKECFGFLGLNGAGKTTTFKILTGEIKPTSGQAFVNGCDIATKMMEARRNLAFCPQFDQLPEFLSVSDTLKLFACIRGLEFGTIDGVVNDLMDTFKLTEFKDKLVQDLSGGNKRKVSSAITFIGRPKVVFLDEPTTGMDPAARRYLWTVIKKARDSGMTIVLTTHSMEECEALSSKLGIMVNGQFKCFGSVQHLKDKFGKGYTLIIKCERLCTDQDLNQVQEFVTRNIPLARLKDKQQETLFYQVVFDRQVNRESEIPSIAQLFTLIETNRQALKLETFSLSQTSLEQVFLSFAREQKSQDEVIPEEPMSSSQRDDQDAFNSRPTASAYDRRHKLPPLNPKPNEQA